MRCVRKAQEQPHRHFFFVVLSHPCKCCLGDAAPPFQFVRGRPTLLIRHAHGHEDVEERAFDAEDAGAHFVDEI